MAKCGHGRGLEYDCPICRNETTVSSSDLSAVLGEDEAGYVEQLEMIIANSDPDGLPEDMGILKAREVWERLHRKYYPANYA